MTRLMVRLLILLILVIPASQVAPSELVAAKPQSYLATFDGTPSSPQPHLPAGWEVVRHYNRDPRPSQPEPMDAQHGQDCAAPPATHPVATVEDLIFLCKDHLMTSLNASDYGALYLAPPALLDFSGGEAVLRFDVSTLRSSSRDWWDVWLTPYADSIQAPLQAWLPDLQGPPRNAIHIELSQENGFRVTIFRNGQAVEEFGEYWRGYDSWLTPSATRRDTFELRLTRASLRWGMPGYPGYPQWADERFADLGWEQAVVQLGQHSYTPWKDGNGGPNTYHWDNVSLSPAVPFTILRSDRARVSDGDGAVRLDFGAALGSAGQVRFTGTRGAQVSLDGTTWTNATEAWNGSDDASRQRNYGQAVPAGTRQVWVRTPVDTAWQTGLAKDFHLWSLAAPVAAPPGTIEPTSSNLGATTWHFAEGYTGAGFDEYLTIQNPNPTAAAVTITYYRNGAPPVVKRFSVPGSSRDTVAVHDPARGVGRGWEVSATVESTNGVGIVVERPMYFTYGLRQGGTAPGGHNVLGVNAPRQSWLFAEGYTGAGFDQYLTIMNPNGTAAPVTITYYRNGAPPVVKTLSAPGSSRSTVVVHDTKEGVGRDQEVSAKVETSHPGGIVVERPMYFAYQGAWRGGHTVMGAVAPRATWHFPDGDTRAGHDAYLTIMNPSGTEAAVSLTYYTGSGATVTRTLTAPANQRVTVRVHETAQGVGREQRPAVTVTSTNGVGLAVERPMYDTTGGDTVLGAVEPRPGWLFAEGYTGAGFSQELVILNPHGTAAGVTITYYLKSGGTVTKTLSAPAQSRRVVSVQGTSEGVGANQEVSAWVETSHPGGIVVERPMTFLESTPGSHTAMGFAP